MRRHLISAACFAAFIAVGAASAPSYDDSPPECDVGQVCGGACIDSGDTCDKARKDELETECTSSPCCVVGKECGNSCIDPSDTCRLDSDPVDDTGSCPTTSACGCSGFRKSECGGACCSWTVGSGCGCR